MADCALCYHSVMVKVLLTTKVNPTYDDLPEDRYHFPRTYLNTIEQAVGDWAIYYEPRRTSGDLSSRGGRMAYSATARITRSESDPSTHDPFYASVADFLELEHPVPLRHVKIGRASGRETVCQEGL